MRRLTFLFLSVLLAAGLAIANPDAARAQGGDNTAIAINTKDGSALFKFAFSIRRVGGEIVDNTNAAVAFASCDSCQTVAIAIQVVLVTGNPDVATPTNLALAYNLECTLCETLASAYQFVFSTGGQVHFTAEGNQALAQLRREFHDLRKEAERLTVVELQQRVAALVDRLRDVLRTELVPAGRSGEAGSEQPAPARASPASEPAPAAQPGGATTTQPPPTATGGGGSDAAATTTEPAETSPAEPETTTTAPAETEPAETTTTP